MLIQYLLVVFAAKIREELQEHGIGHATIELKAEMSIVTKCVACGI